MIGNGSVALPVSIGIAAAIIFFVFEIIVFPILNYATSKCAVLSIQRRLEKGYHVTVKSLSFPLWSEGLLGGLKTHWLLVLFRIILVLIPVYLESKLVPLKQPSFNTLLLPHTFAVHPVLNWYEYQQRNKLDIDYLRDIAENIYIRCTSYDEDGWLIALAANVTYLKNGGMKNFSCVEGTQTRVFRKSPVDVNLLNMSQYDDGFLNQSYCNV